MFVSTLRKYGHDPSHIVELEPLWFVENLAYEEFLVRIVDEMDKVLRNSIVKLMKV